MGKDERTHFESYTPQNRVKHLILGKYLSAYMKALSMTVRGYHYIDGFAGGGFYEGQYSGSPLIAIEILGRQSVLCSASFVEDDLELFPKLKDAITSHPDTVRLFDAPYAERGAFEEHVDGILRRPIYSQISSTATFAFVDPCGAKGVRMQDLFKVLAKPFGECLVFWNYDGVNRWLGAVAAGVLAPASLAEFFGDMEAVAEALNYYKRQPASLQKERGLLELYMRCLKKSGKRYVVPFRFQSSMADRTSHYLIHCSGHHLSFKIMKEVMGGLSSPASEPGTFELLTAAGTYNLFTPVDDDARDRKLAQLAAERVRAARFIEDWPQQADDYMIGADYRRILLELEAAGTIRVLDKDGEKPAPASRRPKRRGQYTLAPDYFVTLA